MYVGAQLKPGFGGFETRLRFIKFGHWPQLRTVIKNDRFRNGKEEIIYYVSSDKGLKATIVNLIWQSING